MEAGRPGRACVVILARDNGGCHSGGGHSRKVIASRDTVAGKMTQKGHLVSKVATKFHSEKSDYLPTESCGGEGRG